MQAWTHRADAQDLRFAPGAAADVGRALRGLGARQVMLVTSPGRLAAPGGQRVVRALGRALASTFAEARPHVPAVVVQAAVRQARRDAVDGLVALGGGASTDLAKAVAFFLAQEGAGPGGRWGDAPSLAASVPLVAVPTTSVGAELTGVFTVTDEASGHAGVAGGPSRPAAVALYDPELAAEVPPRLALASAVVALGHAVDAVSSPRRSPEAEALALAAVSRLAGALPALGEHSDDAEARHAVTAGAVLGGRARQQAGGGVHAGLTRLVAARAGAAYGEVGAVLLPHVLRAALPEPAARQVGAALGDVDDPGEAVAQLVADLGLPQTLAAAGVGDDAVDAAIALAGRDPEVQSGARPLTEEELRRLLAAAR